MQVLSEFVFKENIRALKNHNIVELPPKRATK
jgi:hypothetical protein